MLGRLNADGRASKADEAGRPASGEVALFAVDKALLAVHPDKQNDASPGAQAVAIELFHALSAARAKVAAAEASGVRC